MSKVIAGQSAFEPAQSVRWPSAKDIDLRSVYEHLEYEKILTMSKGFRALLTRIPRITLGETAGGYAGLQRPADSTNLASVDERFPEAEACLHILQMIERQGLSRMPGPLLTNRFPNLFPTEEAILVAHRNNQQPWSLETFLVPQCHIPWMPGSRVFRWKP